VKTIGMLHEYQRTAISHMLEHKHSMLWLDMGLGKTISSLTAIAHLLDCFEIRGCLVIAPMRVVQTVWKQEAANWQHTSHLNVRIVHGKPMIRERAIMTPADVYVVNYENLPWLVNQLNIGYISRGIPLPFDMIIFDEVTKTKSTRCQQGSTRMAPLYNDILPLVDRTAGLTGTPLPNGYVDLFGQYLVLDGGQRLGTAYSSYISRFFSQNPYSYKVEPVEGAKAKIHTLISDITMEMKVDDYLDLPPVSTNEIVVRLSAKQKKQYDKMEADFFHELDSGEEVIIDSKAALSNKCLQFANGAMYFGEERTDWEPIHTLKLDALEELIDGAGDPVLLGYQFRHDAMRIMKRFKDKVVWVNAKVKGKEMAELNIKWNNGQVPVMMGHAASIGHGLNLQYGSHTVAWFGLPWSWELYNQFIKRIAKRQGQKYPVTVHHILAAETLDYAVVTALAAKESDETTLRNAVNEYRRKKYGRT
jgi:SNF2 family DNA or RNA helicase